MKIEKEKKKICKFILKNTCYIIVIFLLLYNILYSINTAISKNDYFSVGGISIFNMDNDLMNDEINKNDIVIVKKVAREELKIGDIVAYKVNDNTRINKIFNYKNGYITKSNKNYQPDIEIIDYDEIIGKKVYIIKNIGVIIVILQSKITSLLILLFLIMYFIYNKKIYNKKKERSRKKKKFLKQK